MATTWNRICLDDHDLVDGDRTFTLKRGREYTTSPERDGRVTVYSTYWFSAPVEWFAGEKRLDMHKDDPAAAALQPPPDAGRRDVVPGQDPLKWFDALHAAPGWQPIDSAPHGQWVLVYFARFKDYAVCRWNDEGQWEDEDDSRYTSPSHWMPLPAPPQEPTDR